MMVYDGGWYEASTKVAGLPNAQVCGRFDVD